MELAGKYHRKKLKGKLDKIRLEKKLIVVESINFPKYAQEYSPICTTFKTSQQGK